MISLGNHFYHQYEITKINCPMEDIFVRKMTAARLVVNGVYEVKSVHLTNILVIFQCIQNSQEMTDDEFTFVNNHQLMSKHVQQELVNNLPYFYKMGVMFEKFVIDTSMYYTVYFISTSKYSGCVITITVQSRLLSEQSPLISHYDVRMSVCLFVDSLISTFGTIWISYQFLMALQLLKDTTNVSYMLNDVTYT